MPKPTRWCSKAGRLSSEADQRSHQHCNELAIPNRATAKRTRKTSKLSQLHATNFARICINVHAQVLRDRVVAKLLSKWRTPVIQYGAEFCIWWIDLSLPVNCWNKGAQIMPLERGFRNGKSRTRSETLGESYFHEPKGLGCRLTLFHIESTQPTPTMYGVLDVQVNWVPSVLALLSSVLCHFFSLPSVHFVLTLSLTCVHDPAKRHPCLRRRAAGN